MTMQSVESSFIRQLGYDDDREVALAVYHDGARFEYEMSREQFEEWLHAPSIGKYFHANIKRKIDGRRV